MHGFAIPGNYTVEDREWYLPENNYDNLFYSMMTFFEVGTLEMWPSIMFFAIDSVSIDHVSILDNRQIVSAIYIFFIFLTSFFIMNLFISVIVDKFNVEIKKRQGAHNFTNEQKEWVKINRLMVTIEPKIIPIEPINKIRMKCFKIVQSAIFEYFIMLAICVNTVCLCVDHYGISPELNEILSNANYTFVAIFTIEAMLKITAYGFSYYWYVTWNKFDFVIVIMSLLALNETLFQSLNFNVTALRIIRVTRLLKMVKTSKGLRSLLQTLYMSLNNIFTTASLLSLILFTFTVAGMSIFGNVEDGEFINKNVNFRSFYIGIMTLARASTGESWNGIMHECYDQTGPEALIFWVVFQLITFFIFMNVFIAVIYDSFTSIQASEDEGETEGLKKKDLKAF